MPTIGFFAVTPTIPNSGFCRCPSVRNLFDICSLKGSLGTITNSRLIFSAIRRESIVSVSTMDLIAAGRLEMQRTLANMVTKIFIDEAHHVKAPTWLSFRRMCDKEKVIQFTATPFRNDGQSLDGQFIFNYSLKKAQEDGYFKKISLIWIYWSKLTPQN